MSGLISRPPPVPTCGKGPRRKRTSKVAAIKEGQRTETKEDPKVAAIEHFTATASTPHVVLDVVVQLVPKGRARLMFGPLDNTVLPLLTTPPCYRLHSPIHSLDNHFNKCSQCMYTRGSGLRNPGPAPPSGRWNALAPSLLLGGETCGAHSQVKLTAVAGEPDSTMNEDRSSGQERGKTSTTKISRRKLPPRSPKAKPRQSKTRSESQITRRLTVEIAN